MANEIIVGLDIGTSKIACFVGVRGENGKVRILGFGKTDSVGVEHGVVRSVTGTADCITRAVREASEQSGVIIEEVWVGIAGQHIKSRTSHGTLIIPPDHMLISQEDVDRLTSEQYNIQLEPGEQIIHVFPQKYSIDNEVVSRDYSPAGTAGRTLEADFHMVTANRDSLRNIRMAVEMANLKVAGVVLEPVASAKAVLDERDCDAGVAMVDIGGGTTDIAIFFDGVIRHTSVLPLAGNVITNDIREGCNILKKQAESLKVKFGSCLVQAVSDKDIISIPGIRSQPPREIFVKTLAQIINARARMLLEQVDYEINVSGFQKKLIAGVVLSGGGAQLQHIKELSELITGTSTRIGAPNEHLDPSSISYEELAHPMYATGIGLLLYGLDHAELNAEPSSNAQAQPSSSTHEDLFKDMETATTAPQETHTPDSESPKDKKPSGGKRLQGLINRTIDILFKEGDID